MRFLVWTVLLILAGCASNQLQETTPREQYERTRHNVLDGGDASEFTLNILGRRTLLDRHRIDPVHAIEVLDREMRETHERDLAIAIAELAMLQTRRVASVDERALATALRYSYAFLFDPQLTPPPDPFDARFRTACDLYNFALAAILRSRPDEIRHTERTWRLAWYAGETTARVAENDFPRSSGAIAGMRIAADYIADAMPPPDLRHGLGVPCMLDRATHQGTTDAALRAKKNRYLPGKVSLSATILVRWPDDASILDGTRAPASIELHDPMETTAVTIANRRVPLEVDFTTPIAELAQKDTDSGGLAALFHVDEYQKRIGLYMFQPYRADRITVLFVHGLASGPETWLPLYNQILSDPTIRTRFQFAFWFYPTGQPALTSASQLRKALEDVHHAYGGDTPLHQAPGLIVCAHSLGGILSSTLVVETDDALWNAAFMVSPDQLPIDDERRDELEAAFMLEPLPYVKRMIYYSSPHRGAPDADLGIMQWASGLIHLPHDLLGEDAALRNYIHKDVRFRRYTVAQSLMAHNAVMEKLADLAAASKVPFHSIIGDKDEAGKVGGTDGFVPYWSSHLDGAQSELIIHSGHSTQHKPRAARETRRILLKHLAERDRKITESAE